MCGMVGIYCITNKVNNKVYIGESVDIAARIRQHKYDLAHNIHVNKHLQAAWNFYGEDNFNFSVVEVLPNDCPSELRFAKEALWIDKFGGVNSDLNYNLITGFGFGGHSEESKKKMSESLKSKYRDMPHPSKGRKDSEETKRKKSITHKGKKHSAETKLKIGESQKGKHISVEHREKLRQLHLGKPGYMKGKHFSKEFCEHNRIAHLGIKPTDEARRHIAEACRNAIHMPVVQLSLCGDVIQRFRSVAEASRVSGCPYGCIYDTCKGRQNTGRGYRWEFITKEEYINSSMRAENKV